MLNSLFSAKLIMHRVKDYDNEKFTILEIEMYSAELGVSVRDLTAIILGDKKVYTEIINKITKPQINETNNRTNQRRNRK